MELGRQVELIVGDTLGPGAVGNFFAHCGRELAAGASAKPQEDVPPLWHGLRCRLFEKLGAFVGFANLGRFFDDLLDAARFERIERVEPEMAFGDGPRPEVFPGTPVFAPLRM